VTNAPNQTTLISAILEGAFETPPWSSFLDQLKRITQAEYVTFLLRPPGRPVAESLHLFKGDATDQEVYEKYYNPYSSLDILSAFELQEGQIYSFDQLYPSKNSEVAEFYDNLVVPSGITACRMLKVTEPSGVSAWLAISRRVGDFTRKDDANLLAITPILRGALRHHVALEQARFAAAVTSDAMRRLHFGWAALDAQGVVVDHDPEAGRVFALSRILSKGPGGRLEVHLPHLKAGIMGAIHDLANGKGKARAFTLSQDPWLDMLIVQAISKGMSSNPRASVIAYVHGDSWSATDRCEQLTQLFGLSPSEARLAFALSRGMNIAQAAEFLGIKIETARKCTKLIYGKTGAGGLPDLVRLVMRSILVLAPTD
jgi:DNA-binding CsgD family transcriptional regulator